MAHGKETPRQKMIGMMYLVLTALLALNVSKSILDAFIMVDESLTVTTENFNQDNKKVYEDFDKAFASNPTRVKPWKEKADEIKKQAEDLYNYINSLKVEIVKKADGDKAEAIDKNKIDPRKIKATDNTDKPAQIMVGDNNNGKARILKQKIDKFREVILSYIDKKDVDKIKAIEKSLNTEGETKEGVKETWESYHFEHWPLLAVTTIMSKMQSDVRNAESEIMRYLYNKIDLGSFKFNKLEATIIPNSNYILKGNEYQAEVFLAAFDTTQTPNIVVDGKSIPIKNGRGIYTVSGGAPGNRKWGGFIEMKATDGTVINKPFKAEYQVAEATAVISPTKMNVFYLGVDNPVSISVAGVPADKVTSSITNGNGVIRKVGNSYIVNPARQGIAIVSVVADIDGKKKPMGAMEFKVKEIPPPIPMVGGRKFGTIEKNVLLAQMIVQANLENFDFDAKFTVTEFNVSAVINGFTQDVPVKSYKITDAQRNIIRNAPKGSRVLFTGIKAVGPDGKPRDLTDIVFKIQ